ncbi:MAG: uracil-DNA glycosylase [Spirochaetes bacterium]|nr:uracil-DNA glycosylase [Spirochaetota bacterium]
MDRKDFFNQYNEILLDFQDLLRTPFRNPARDPAPAVGFVDSVYSEENTSGRNLGGLEERNRALEQLAKTIQQCTRCRLSQERTHTVPGMGVLDPLVMVIGEGPGAEEDRQGLPFVGAAGQFLDKWLAAIGLSRETNVYIANMVKCRPPGNRDPQGDEVEACLPYLVKQVELVNPRSILTVGRIASQSLLGTTKGISSLRGTVHEWKGIPLIATYHPSAVLRDMNLKRPVWEDLKRLKTLIDPLLSKDPE